MRNEGLGIRNAVINMRPLLRGRGPFTARGFFITVLFFMFAGAAFAGDLFNDSTFNNMPQIKNLNMSGMMPNYQGTGSFNSSDAPDINLSRMKSMNPDFTTYENENGIIWLKHVDIETSGNGLEITRLYVILGRNGIDKKWLTWNIQTPADGEAEILAADVYDFNTLRKIESVIPEEDNEAKIKTINFRGMPERFILVVAWKENIFNRLSVEGLCWFQEDLRVWEAVLDIHSPHELKYKTFPAVYPPETEFINNEHLYTWRRINIDPSVSSKELARLQRQGVIFGARSGSVALTGILKEIENSVNISAPSEAGQNAQKIISWLMKNPEIELAEGTARKIPSLSSPLTKKEKLLLAYSWLTSKKINASLNWQLPFEPEENSLLCPELFFSPVLEYSNGKKSAFHDMRAPQLLAGAKIFGLNSESEILTSRRIPSSKSAENRMSAIMELNLNEKGLLNGTVRILLRGSWGAFMFEDNNPNSDEIKSAMLSLFPALKNYKDLKFRMIKGVPEISFKIENLSGIAGSGKGILAVLPFFEPVAMRKLGGYEAPVEVLFPFIVDQNINLVFPENATEALISGRVDRAPEKINFSSNYNNNRRKRLIADSRFEINLQNVSANNMPDLQRCLDQWRAFSSRHIPVR